MVLKHLHTMSTIPCASTTTAPAPEPKQMQKKQINLLRGWPSPALLPNQALLSAARTALTDPASFVPGLQYGPDPGYGPLRRGISDWLSSPGCYGASRYRDAGEGTGGEGEAEGVKRICVTGGASQAIACVLQSFTDPGYTRAVWMVAPCYFLAGPIFEDAGFYGADGRLRGFGEDGEGADVDGRFAPWTGVCVRMELTVGRRRVRDARG